MKDFGLCRGRAFRGDGALRAALRLGVGKGSVGKVEGRRCPSLRCEGRCSFSGFH